MRFPAEDRTTQLKAPITYVARKGNTTKRSAAAMQNSDSNCQPTAEEVGGGDGAADTQSHESVRN